jgi:hypothetical protein
LVPSYTEVASGYKELDLATCSIPDLFMPEKLPYAPQTPRTASLTLSPERPEPGTGKPTSPEFPPGLPAVEAWSTTPSRVRAASASYRDGLRIADPGDRRNASPGDDDRASSVGSGAAPASAHLTNKGRRQLNPALVCLHRQYTHKLVLMRPSFSHCRSVGLTPQKPSGKC